MRCRTMFALAASALIAAGCEGGEEGNNQAVPANATAGNAAAAEIPDTTIAQTLAGSEQHSTLVNAIKTAGLEATMSGTQPYTLFAPTNAAFQKLPGGGADLMREESKGQLTALLTAHIVPGVVTAADLRRAIERGDGRAQLATVGGTTLTVAQDGDALVVSDASGGQARIGQADLLQSNGVVHVVDTVLTPGGGSAPAAQ